MPEEYLTIAELASRLKVSPKTIRNKMANRTFVKGVHYFKRAGMTVRFKWSAVVHWLENPQPDDDSVPMARGYNLATIEAGIPGCTYT